MRLSALFHRAQNEEGDRSQYWFARLSTPIICLILALAAAGAYLAFSIPISVFPNTDFPRVVIRVDHGVLPIHQMLGPLRLPIEPSVYLY